MIKSEFKLKNVPSELGDKDAAERVQVIVGAVWIVVVAMIAINIFMPGDESNWEWWRWVMLALVFVIAIGLNIVNWTPIGNRLSAMYYAYDNMKKLATANGLKMFGRRRENYDKQYYPAIAQLGIRPRDEFGCEGIIAGTPVAIYAHSYRSQWIQYDIGRTWTLVIKLGMPRLMPHTFLQTRNNAKGSVATSVARTFDDEQRVSLQNNLDDYFIFYTHRRTVTDALALWSPQLLHSLRELDCQLNVETIGKDIYIYGNYEGDKPVDMKKQMKFVEEVAKSAKRSLRVDFLQLPNENKYPYLRSRPAGGLVMFAGKYFAFGWVVLAYYIVSAGLRLLHEGLGTEDFWWKLGFLVGGTIAGAIFLLYTRSSYTKTKQRRGI